MTDLRRGFDGLSARVQNVLHEQPFSGHVFQWPFDCTHPKPGSPPHTDYTSFSSAERQAI